jgi:hypothetical protein
LQQVARERVAAFEQLAGERVGELERLRGTFSELEQSTTELLHELERQLERRQADVEALVDERIAALTQHVHWADAALVQRIREFDARAQETGQAMEARLTRTGDEQAQALEKGVAASTSRIEANMQAAIEEQVGELDATRAAMKKELLDALARAEAALAPAGNAQRAEVAEMLTTARAALDQVTNRVEGLEAIAVRLGGEINELRREIADAGESSGQHRTGPLDRAGRRERTPQPVNAPDRRDPEAPLY